MTTIRAADLHQTEPLSLANVRPPKLRWDAWRRKVVAGSFRRIFGRAGGGLCEPGQLPTRGIHRVLICRPNHRLGNTVLISPMIREIEALYPGAEIDILASAAAVSLFSSRFRVRTVFALPNKAVRHLIHTASLLRTLRASRYDLAIDACNGSQSGRLALALVKARYKLGFPDRALNPDSPWFALDWPAHHAQGSVFLLRKAYAGNSEDVGYPPLDVDLSTHEREEAASVLAALRRGAALPGPVVVGIFTNATGAKRYDELWWRQFLATFREHHSDVQIVDVVAAHGSSQLGDGFVPFYTQNLRRLASLVANMQGFISADCGVMHLAAASGTPTLGLFSKTNSAKYAPYGGANTALDTGNMDAATVGTAAARWFDHVREASRPISGRPEVVNQDPEEQG